MVVYTYTFLLVFNFHHYCKNFIYKQINFVTVDEQINLKANAKKSNPMKRLMNDDWIIPRHVNLISTNQIPGLIFNFS